MLQSRTSAAEAWTLFWAEQGQNSRCLALSRDFCQPLDAHWHRFAASLTEHARVIDLGCGLGAVGRALRSAQPRLQVTGIDSAQVTTSAEPGLEIVANAAMECLPFADASFAAAVSQFGYEYAAEPHAAANEIARVVVPGGSLSFLVHHDEGPVIAAMRRHRRAIEGLCGPDMKEAFLAGEALMVRTRIAELKRECADDSLVETAGRALQSQLANDQTGRDRVWKAIVQALAPELAMLKPLDLSTPGGRSIDGMIEPLATSFDLQSPSPLRTADAEPIAWIVEGSRL